MATTHDGAVALDRERRRIGDSQHALETGSHVNPYTTMSEARIRQGDVTAILHGHGYRAGPHLAALERQRGWWAEAEVDWLLGQNRGSAGKRSSLVSSLRRLIGGTLVGVGRRLAGEVARRAPSQAAPQDRFDDVGQALLGEATRSR